MKCPKCNGHESKVYDSRPKGEAIFRRRECQRCQWRWETWESTNCIDLSDSSSDYYHVIEALKTLDKEERRIMLRLIGMVKRNRLIAA